ncbi:lysozyme inhibitor LprI family protein [Azospirillum sp. TSO35-2]|uniref:lysozyme inhibitor LprI family protein n=1 Tax=Azospirillum sp. TSO35-2 TaxID=716796 RepID=UPI001FFF59F4|nr:lysozyme inhibitor LprI family protein [Azospirillum sp. TSO35-2]
MDRSIRVAQPLHGRAARAGAVPVWALLVWSVLGGASAQASPSFDCKAAATPVEKAICADSKLADADQEIADVYKTLQGLSGTADKERLRSEQKAWIAQRNGCATAASPGACLGPVLDARRKALGEAVPAAVATVAGIVDGIAGDPAGAGRRLAELRGGLGKGWTAYLLRFGPSPDPAKANTLLREAVEGIDDSFARETAQGLDTSTDDGFLTALRVVSDEVEMAWPCSVMERRGKPAWKAMEPLYGSNRDNFGQYPTCKDDGALLDAPAWKAVDALLAPMLEAASARTGTIRSATFRQLNVDRLKSAVDPRLFVGDAPELAPLVTDAAGWRNPRWIDAGWGSRFRAAVDAAVAAWTPLLATRYGIATADARRIAEAVAAQGLSGSVGLITDNMELQKDTRLPDWLRGSWSWSGGADDTPFAAPSGTARIDAANVCVGTDCTGYDVAEQGEGVEIDAKQVKALGVTPAPGAAKQAVSLVSATGGSVTAIPLAGGNALVSGYGKATVLKRAAK